MFILSGLRISVGVGEIVFHATVTGERTRGIDYLVAAVHHRQLVGTDGLEPVGSLDFTAVKRIATLAALQLVGGDGCCTAIHSTKFADVENIHAFYIAGVATDGVAAFGGNVNVANQQAVRHREGVVGPSGQTAATGGHQFGTLEASCKHTSVHAGDTVHYANETTMGAVAHKGGHDVHVGIAVFNDGFVAGVAGNGTCILGGGVDVTAHAQVAHNTAQTAEGSRTVLVGHAFDVDGEEVVLSVEFTIEIGAGGLNLAILRKVDVLGELCLGIGLALGDEIAEPPQLRRAGQHVVAVLLGSKVRVHASASLARATHIVVGGRLVKGDRVGELAVGHLAVTGNGALGHIHLCTAGSQHGLLVRADVLPPADGRLVAIEHVAHRTVGQHVGGHLCGLLVLVTVIAYIIVVVRNHIAAVAGDGGTAVLAE